MAKPLPSIFIDTYFHPDQPTERAKFAQNTHKLLTFAQSVQPFECKDIEIALHEIREMQNNMNKLKSESEEKTKIMQQLIEERHALETRLERLEAGVGAAATPPMSDRREAGIFCSNNKSVFSLRIACITRYRRTALLPASVAYPDPGFGIRCLVDPWIRDSE